MADGFGAYFSDFVPDRAGIVEVFTSAGMQSALAQEASRLCSQANSMAHLSHATNGFPTPYEDGVSVLSFTAVGFVTTANRAGRADQGAHHTLDSLNH